MQKFKLILIILIFIVFSLFIGLEARDYGNGNFTGPFAVTLVFGLLYAALITSYYAGAKTSYIKRGDGTKRNYANPLDIWLLSIPMCVLMIVAYLLLRWHVAEVFFCTMISLSGMFFANNLGRGSGGTWHIKKSFPFFLGCIATIIYSIIIGGIM
jgi:hypothetical protein